MKKYYWLKLKDTFFGEPKIKKLRRIAGGDTYTIIFQKIMLLSIKQQGYIQYEHIEPTFAEELALVLDEEIENVKVTLTFMQANNLIEAQANDTFFLPHVPALITSECDSAERMRAWRAKKEQKELAKTSHCDARVTERDAGRDARVTASDTDIDIDQDQDYFFSDKTKKATTTKKASLASLEKIRAYIAQEALSVDAERFFAYYEANGWRVGRNPMQNWQATLRSWHLNAVNSAAGGRAGGVAGGVGQAAAGGRKETLAERNERVFDALFEKLEHAQTIQTIDAEVIS